MSVASAGNVLRSGALKAAVAAVACLAGCATTSAAQSQDPPGPEDTPPSPQQMDASRALGVWRSTFGAVKIEPDSSHGGIEAGGVHGVWVYDRQGEEVVGYFAGNLRGNVLQFHWQEPSNPPLTGEGFLVFDGQGRQYSGRWWSDRRERVGDWSGWRQPPQVGADPRGRGDGNAPVQRRQPSLYQRSPYQQPYPQQQPYQQQPAPGQPAPQPQQQPAQPAQQPGYSET